MNQLEIGNTILRLRKEKGITQEQLAGMVGVSPGAVCKWETGNSTPDISLLSPLARALDVSLDGLLSFHPELSDAEVQKMKAELITIFMQDGYQSGREKCKDLLNKYPNSIFLKLTVAGLIQVYSMLLSEESEELYVSQMKAALNLLDQVMASNNTRYASQALFSIASIQMRLENYDESEKALKELIHSFVDPMAIYPSLLQRQGKSSEAKVLCEQMLLFYLNQSSAMLAALANISAESGDTEQPFLYTTAICMIEDLFDFGLHTGEYITCKLYLKAGQLKPAAEHFKIYAAGLTSAGLDYSDHPFFKDVRLEVNQDGQQTIRKRLYQNLIDDTSLKILEGFEDYEQAIQLLKDSLI